MVSGFLVGGFADVEKFYQQCDPGELATVSDSPFSDLKIAEVLHGSDAVFYLLEWSLCFWRGFLFASSLKRKFVCDLLLTCYWL